MQPGASERRQGDRVARAFMVRYQPPASRGSDSWAMSPLKNFSRTGARFFSDYEFKVGEWILLQMLLPSSKQPVWLKARVVWMKPGPMGMVDVGVAFGLSEPAAQQAIEQAVTFLQR